MFAPKNASPQTKAAATATSAGASHRIIQTKLVVGQVDDPLERDADRVADQVMRMPDPNVSIASGIPQLNRKCAACQEDEDKIVRPKAAGTATANTSEVPGIVHEVLRSPGQPLDARSRAFFEPRFNRDFAHIRIHADDQAARSAQSVHALAYATGPHIVFAAGHYQPKSPRGRHLLAHELAHVVQQSGGSAALQRQPDRPAEEHLREVRGRGDEQVRRIVMSCKDMTMRFETDTIAHIYKLMRCDVPLGSYEAPVTTTLAKSPKEKNLFQLDFIGPGGEHEAFHLEVWVQSNQQDPAKLLEGQSQVHVDVVDHLPTSQRTPEKEKEKENAKRHKPQCLIEVADRLLVPSKTLSRKLFNPLEFKKQLWAHKIPLGQFGWIDVTATADANLSGTLSASYGPGWLSDICLTTLLDRPSSSAPNTGETTVGIGGRARFRLPARLNVNIVGNGKLVIAGEALSVIEVAAAEGALTARGQGTLSGAIDGSVEILASATHSAQTPEASASPAPITPENTKINDIDLAAEIGLSGRADLMFSVGLSASFKLVGFTLWSRSWNPAPFKSHVAWSGGLKYSSNPGIHLGMGVLGVDQGAPGGAMDLNALGEHEDDAEVHGGDIIDSLLDDSRTTTRIPDGLSQSTALPFDWYKPMELYPDELELPNANQIHEDEADRPRRKPKPKRLTAGEPPVDQPDADPANADQPSINEPEAAEPEADEPKTLSRNAGPTVVEYYDYRHRLQRVKLGVSDWPSIGRTFKYTPYSTGERETPEQDRFNKVLDKLGYDRSGLDAEHVWDVGLRGLEYDRFSNLWPASNQEQQLAGTKHQKQMDRYGETLQRVQGRWFRIVRVRHPADP